MICKQCGNEIREDARFCPHCGALNSPGPGGGLPQGAAPYTAPAYTGPEAPVPGGGKKKGLMIGGVIAAVVIVAILVVVIGGLFSSPKDQLKKAFVKSTAAYAQAWNKLGIPDLSPLSLEQSISQRMALRLEGIHTEAAGYDLSALEGLGLRMNTGLSGKDRRLGMELAAFWDEEDIISLQIAAEDDELYFASPELTEGGFYGVNTETLGDDLTRMTGDDSMEDLSFNLFDLADIAVSTVEQQQEAKEDLKEANKALWDAMTVKKGGKATISVNKHDVKTDIYQVTIPQEAMEDYADTLVDLTEAADYTELYQEIFQAMGMPQDELDDYLTEMDPYGALADSLQEAIEELGDLDLTVHVGGGYVSAVICHTEIDGSEVFADLHLGGGEEYVDYLSLDLNVDGTVFKLESTGNHGCKNGAFTDKTTMRAAGGKVASEFRYDPKGTGNNLSWDVSFGTASLGMEGKLSTTKNSVELSLENMSFKFLGAEMLTLSMNYYAGPYDGQGVTVSSPRLVPEMDGFELMALAVKVESNAQNWLNRTEELFTSRLPEELLQMLM